MHGCKIPPENSNIQWGWPPFELRHPHCQAESSRMPTLGQYKRMEEPPNISEKNEKNYFPPVTEQESGQKLIRFLERRLGLPSSLLHRWLRTGQIRLNGCRGKPFARVAAGDEIRLPPFAGKLAVECGFDIGTQEENSPLTEETMASILPVIGRAGDIWALFKPAGLPSQPGSGHEDSVSSRLAALFANSFFKPAPCHRLDRDTSGILLVGGTFSALRSTQEALREGLIHKEYLGWVQGKWPWADSVLIRHYLRKEGQSGFTRMRVYKENVPWSRESVCVARPVTIENGRSLLQIRLATGRSHQIRAQLAHLGFPLTGDGKYGKPKPGTLLKLHASRIILPDGEEFQCAPRWGAEMLPPEDPPPLFPGISHDELLTIPEAQFRR